MTASAIHLLDSGCRRDPLRFRVARRVLRHLYAAGDARLITVREHVVRERLRRRAGGITLVRVLEDWCPPFPGFYLYCPAFSGSRAQVPLKLRFFIDFLQARLT